MTTNEYLEEVLKSQTLAEDSEELKALREHRAEVEALLRDHFDECSPTIRYGGSKAKKTMIRESYDLDIICYFPHDDTAAGETLEDIFINVRSALEKKYLVEPKTSALRLKHADRECLVVDFHIDVVPGRFTDDSKTDTFLYQDSAEKKRLKTNIDVHVEHVRDSGLTDAIRLVKLWKIRNGLTLKHFVLELAVIKLLSERKNKSLSVQLEHVWTELRDSIDELVVEDPANPEGNDLTNVLGAARDSLRSAARTTLELIETSGWEAVFGATEKRISIQTTERLRRVAASVAVPSRPWCPDES
jgi:tRNA nucleotidyltransferase (CCA-adding enzyme)